MREARENLTFRNFNILSAEFFSDRQLGRAVIERRCYPTPPRSHGRVRSGATAVKQATSLRHVNRAEKAQKASFQ